MSRFGDQAKSTSPDPNTLVLSLDHDQLALFAAASSQKTVSTLLITSQDYKASVSLTSYIQQWSNALNVNHTWHHVSGQLTDQEQTGQIVSRLSQTFHHLLNRTPGHHFVLSNSALNDPIPDPKAWHKQQLQISISQKLPLQKFLAQLVALGFVRYQENLEAGAFTTQGENIAIKHPLHSGHYTITLYGQLVERIVHHHAGRQQAISSLTIPPVAFPPQQTSIDSITHNLNVIRPQAHANLIGQHTVIHDALHPDLPFPLTPHQTKPSRHSNWHIFYQNKERVNQYLKAHHIKQGTLCKTPLASQPFHFVADNTFITSETALFPNTTTKAITYQQGKTLLAELTEGRPAVHSEHGIGIYEGLQTRTFGDTTREYLVLRYAGGDSVSVPVEYAHKITAYLGESTPAIARLGNATWKKTHHKAQQDAEQFARDLLATAGQRAKRQRSPHHIDPSIDKLIEQGFAHTLTPDQARAWQEVASDLQQTEPMDRLIVGDVGFGKTEIALRAAAHVAAAGRQVAILAPTTLLVQQHSDTFQSRLAKSNLTTATASRFSSPQQLNQVHQQIATGQANIVIGTHALLSKKVHWQNLGLIIIDEEQRFGVAQKEHFKKIRSTIDILSLSATPIPRTLSMALTGLKNLSVISSPPQGRKSVVTNVSPDSDQVIQKAIEQELARSGQLYIVAPKIHQLTPLARRVRELCPTANSAIAHGRLPASELAAIMHQFDTGELDILISSTIIESGIDLPNANTMIVTHATNFGLADLYQLRGRIGRRARQGYAWFLFNQSNLTSVQRHRLTALTEASRLGSGWSLAQRDLEIRGAGNLLGAAQSGTVDAIGVQLYLDMINESVRRQQGQSVHRRDVEIQLPLTASIPATYVADVDTRSHLYQKLSRASAVNDLDDVYQNICQQYGSPPPELINLHQLITLQHQAAQAGILNIASKTITPPGQAPYQKLILQAKNTPQLLPALQPLGHWQVNDDTIILETPSITIQLIKQLIKQLN